MTVTTRGLLVGVAGAGALAGGLAARSEGLLLLAAAIGAVLALGIAAVVRSRGSPPARLGVALPRGTLRVGEDAEIGLRIERAARSWRTHVYVEAVLRREEVAAETARVPRVARRRVALRVSGLLAVEGAGTGTAEVALSVPTSRRGMLRLAPPRLWRTDALGLFARTAGAGPAARVVVCPRPALVAAPFGDVLGVGAQDRRGRGEAGDDDDRVGVRPYEPGDRLSLVHWPTTARRGEPMVREEEGDAVRRLALLVDLRAPVREAGALEAVVSLAAGAGLAAIGAGWRVELGALDERGVRTEPAAEEGDGLLAGLAVIDGGRIACGRAAHGGGDGVEPHERALVTWVPERGVAVVRAASCAPGGQVGAR